MEYSEKIERIINWCKFWGLEYNLEEEYFLGYSYRNYIIGLSSSSSSKSYIYPTPCKYIYPTPCKSALLSKVFFNNILLDDKNSPLKYNQAIRVKEKNGIF